MTESAGSAYRDYYRTVELYWSLARGNQIIVSPLEFASIEGWYRSEVPLAVVKRAIDLFIEKKQKAKRKRSFLLSHAESTVKKCLDEYRSLHQGSGEETDLLGSKVKALVRKLKKLAKEQESAAALVHELIAQLTAVDTNKIVQFDDLDVQLQGMEARMVDWFAEKMDPAEIAEIRDEVSELLPEEEEPDLYKKLVSDSIRTHFNLPRLTLLG